MSPTPKSRLGALATCLWTGLVAVSCGTERTEASPSLFLATILAHSDALRVDATAHPARGISGGAATPDESGAVDVEDEVLPERDLMPETLAEQRAAMLRRMRAMHHLEESQVAVLESILAKSKRLGQGNPEIVEHPMTRAECVAKRQQAGVHDAKKPRCGSPYMVPIFDPATQTEADATVCIDRYEFPGMPCEYPVTWVTTGEAQEMCQAMGKRLCDAHEWEGGCAGALRPPSKEYNFRVNDRDLMRGPHNVKREVRWAYGEEKDHAKCATGSAKSKTCTIISWGRCGSNTYPAGAFPECRSPFGVYDQHGNVAEHMSIPRQADELGSRGGIGVAEMKGSWFIFGSYEAHEDDCRWRAPSWHDEDGMSHSNYHLGFRCCKDVK